MKKTVVVISGGFDPIHSGHIELIKKASALGDKLIVGLNSDGWLTRKKGRSFMCVHERRKVLEAIKWVDEVWEFDDSDDSACDLLEQVTMNHPSIEDTIIFANGGDRTEGNIREMEVPGIQFVFGVGGSDKKNSSSWILEEWKAPKVERPWGYYRVLHEVEGCKVKELTVNPKKSLSMQKHFKRHELWHVTEGKCIVNQQMQGGYQLPPLELTTHSQLSIPQGDWHQLTNPFNEPCKIVEIQYGTHCEEEDIERET
jgi:cytidyltransferase-like protein